MNEKIYNVLFLCTGNSARSILAEAILQRDGQGRFQSFSAGSQPKASPHPLAIELLQKENYETGQFRSKSWDEFAGKDAAAMDFIFTVCDNAAGEACPLWPGHPASAHWGLPDPAAEDGPLSKQRHAFAECYRMLSSRISLFVNLPLGELNTQQLKDRLDAIGVTQELGARRT